MASIPKPVDCDHFTFGAAIDPINISPWDVQHSSLTAGDVSLLEGQGLIWIGNARHKIAHDVVTFLCGYTIGESQKGSTAGMMRFSRYSSVVLQCASRNPAGQLIKECKMCSNWAELLRS